MTDDVLRSVIVSVNVLGTREIMLVQHTQCGMRAEADEDLAEAVEAAAGGRPTLELHSFQDIEESLVAGLARLRREPLLSGIEAARGFVYDVESGALREVTAAS